MFFFAPIIFDMNFDQLFFTVFLVQAKKIIMFILFFLSDIYCELGVLHSGIRTLEINEFFFSADVHRCLRSLLFSQWFQKFIKKLK